MVSGKESTFLGYYSTFLGNESTFLGKESNLFREDILINSIFCGQGVESEFSRSSLGVLSVELGKV